MMNKRIVDICIIMVCMLFITGCITPTRGNRVAGDYLQSWVDDSPNKHKIIDFVTAVTDKNSKAYVPVEDRIATFDMDGTIVCEEPLWLELAVAEYRIVNDLKDPQLKAEMDKLNKDLATYPEPEETSQLIEDVTGKAAFNMPQEEFVKYTENFMQTKKPGFVDLKYKDTFYKPMLELFEYLLANEFQVYIVSGSERGVIWGACREILPMLPRSHKIGSDIVLKAKLDTGADGGAYIFKMDDELIRQLGFTQKCLNMGKIYNIYHQIGEKPILAFGNTDGDFCMLNYAKSNKKYRSIAFLLCHDDNVREYDYHVKERADWNAKAAQYDWNIVFMSTEFKEVFMKKTEKQ